MRLKVRTIPWFLSWKGLLGQRPEQILLKTRFGIHTFGMKESIDVIILDKKNVVRKLTHSLLPNKIFLWNPFFNTVVELPSGSIKRKKIQLGQTVQVETI